MTTEDELSTEWVPKYYTMDPATEDLLFDGTHLRTGMIVLYENDLERVDIERIKESMRPVEQSMADKWNRWCRVDNPKVNEGSLEFVGVYGDGTKRKFNVDVDKAWFVKKSTISPNTWTVSEEEGS
jgi:hypothetical protein